MSTEFQIGDRIRFHPKQGTDIYMQCPKIGSIGTIKEITFDRSPICLMFGIVLSCAIVSFDGCDYDQLVYVEDLVENATA